jgi:hypothetical protein
MSKAVLLASFIFKDRLDWFLNHLLKSFNIPKTNIFVYDINDEYKYMVTYKFIIETDQVVNFKDILPNATITLSNIFSDFFKTSWCPIWYGLKLPA